MPPEVWPIGNAAGEGLPCFWQGAVTPPFFRGGIHPAGQGAGTDSRERMAGGSGGSAGGGDKQIRPVAWRAIV